MSQHLNDDVDSQPNCYCCRQWHSLALALLLSQQIPLEIILLFCSTRFSLRNIMAFKVRCDASASEKYDYNFKLFNGFFFFFFLLCELNTEHLNNV